MTSALGALFRCRRVALRLTRTDVALQIGYRNPNKGARRVERLEDDGVAPRDLVARVAAVLGLDPQEVVEVALRDDAGRLADFEAWLRGPQPMVLCGFAAGVTFQVPLPEGLTEEHAITHAVAEQQRLGVRMCLVLDRRRSLWISPDGKSAVIDASPGRSNFPRTTAR